MCDVRVRSVYSDVMASLDRSCLVTMCTDATVRRVAASEVDLVVTRDSERANALRAIIPCVYELNPVAFIP